MMPLLPPESVELQIENEIDSICDAFEADWREGKRPKIEDYLSETIVNGRSTLLLELVRVEAYYRQKQGESPQLSEYLIRFPKDAPLLSARGLEQALSPPPAVANEARGSIGTFDLLELLGEGAFGCVWKARDRKLDRIVALKLPRGAGLSEAEAVAFLREAQAAAQLRHPHIVAVFGVERDEQTAYIVSEYIDGMNLKEWLKQNRPTFDESARLIVTMAEALGHAHAQGVVHRDLKPANILLDRDGEPHLTDFGLAKRISGEGSIHSGQHVLGTPAYMSPEQAAGNSSKVDPRTDLYSLGIILYELLTGCRAFEGDQQTLLRLVVSAEPKPPREIRPEIPKSLETICLKAIAKDRDQRYPTVEDFAADLNRYLRSEPVQARAPRAAQSGSMWTRRRFTGVALAALPVGGYALWSGVSKRHDETHRPITMQTDPAGAEVSFIPLDKFTGEPDANRIVHAGRSPVSLELAPGDYLVEVVLDDRRFHEVYRHVPDVTETLQAGFAHQLSMPQPGGEQIVLPVVFIPPASVIEDMARIAGNPKYAIGQSHPRQSWQVVREIPAFFMQPTEFTFRDYRRLNDGRIPKHFKQFSSDHAVPVEFDTAMAIAERLGMRLPDQSEFEFVATAGGTRPFPWTGPAAPVEGAPQAAFGPVKDSPMDRIDLDPLVPIFGLCSNVAEWTINWGRSEDVDVEIAKECRQFPFDSPGDCRIVRGGTLHVVQGNPVVSNETRNPREQLSVPRRKRMSGLGGRFVRSVKPRLFPADFVRILPDIAES